MSEEIRKVEGYSPGACSSCWRETDELTRSRSVHYGDEEYVSESEGHRAWFHWYCDLCRTTYAANAHKYGYSDQTLYALVAQVGWRIIDELRADRPNGEDEDG